MSINNVQGLLIQPNLNNDNNTTRLMKVDTIYSNIITDGIATINNGYISNLIEPTANNQIATKYYIDNSGGGGGSSGPNGAIQYNSAGNFTGSANLTLTDPGLPSATLNINGILTNGTMTMSGSQISGLSNPTNAQEAATKNYVDQSVNKLSDITIDINMANGITFTPEQVYNTIINIQNIINNFIYICPFNPLPTALQMKTFLGSEFTVGKTWITSLRGPRETLLLYVLYFISTNLSPITYGFFSLPLSQTTVASFSVSTILSVVTNDTPGSEEYKSYCISNVSDFNKNAQITGKGLITPSFINTSITGTGCIIHPIPANPSINSSAPIIYTYSNLKKFFIIRTGLISDTIDTFVPASVLVTDDNFSMGGGTFRFFIQNPNGFNLTLQPSIGWSFAAENSNVIPANYCGAFWVTVTISPASCIIRCVGINPING